ncbi:MAG: hypothetical protein OEO79_07790 [Gemmatimonadota bacterium]|nr:hypothetical protein [Gemmatimonadota bacterium]MDH3423090.1 hypothetical protein [Gemmatimonadota bacterium]
MEIPTLVVSDPPHRDVDIDIAAALLGLDVFGTRLKANFAAPEVMLASDAEKATRFTAQLRAVGFDASILQGATLRDLPWPDLASSLAFDASGMRATVQDTVIDIPYDSEIVGVHCRPPGDDRTRRTTVDIDRAVASGHGPTIAAAIERRGILDLYFLHDAAVRRVTIVPDWLDVDEEGVMKELVKRAKHLRLDARLRGVRPRAPFMVGDAGHDGPERRRYSFGTQLLREVLESISPDLRAVPQYEIGSRLAYALNPLGSTEGA